MCKCRRSKLWLYFTGIVFVTVVAVFIVITGIWYLLFAIDVININPRTRHIPIAMFLVSSILIGSTIAVFVGKLFIRPIQNISEAFDKLSKGNFDTRVPTNEKISEIREMAKRFNAMTYDLSHIETLRSDFVVNVSHEFKTPLAAVSGYATLLQNPNLSKKQHDKYVTIILDNIERLTKLSGDILTISKLENRETVLQMSSFILDEQIRKQILLLEGKWSAKNIEFDIELPKIMYYGSESLLAQVWSNLIDNAIKASFSNGVIHIDMKEQSDCLTITITDHGIGMSEDVQKHIFEKFYQGETSHKAEGNGLGLPMVKRILELCNGKISVCSAPDKGTSVLVTVKK